MPKQTDIQKLQAQIDTLMKERADRGDSSKPVDINLQALKGHLVVRQDSLPQYDFSDLISRAGELDAEKLDADKTAALVFAIERFIKKNGPIAHELAVPLELAENAHQHALDAKANNQTPAFDAEDEDVTADDEDAGITVNGKDED